MNAISFSGGNYIAAPPTNITATPKIKNITVANMRLSRVSGAYQGISTLKESPIDGLFLRNISFTMAKVHRASWCADSVISRSSGWSGCTISGRVSEHIIVLRSPGRASQTAPALHADKVALTQSMQQVPSKTCPRHCPSNACLETAQLRLQHHQSSAATSQ